MPRTQQHRVVAIASPLGEDVLLLRSLHLTEQLGRPFQMELSLLSDDPGIAFKDIVGQNVTVRFETGEGESRFFNGFVSRFVQSSGGGRLGTYQATVVPWLWFLTRMADCRIFQNMSIPDIIKEVFRLRNFSDFEEMLSGNYQKREYCVQYRETDFNFVSRLMEQEGIYYYFKHEDGKHTLVLSDSRNAHEPLPGPNAQLPLVPEAPSQHDRESVWDWTLEQQVQPGIYVVNDFEFKAPRKRLWAQGQIVREHAVPEYEVFDYPGEYPRPSRDIADGETIAKTRIEELHAEFETARAETDAHWFTCGHTFELTNHPREDQNREYLVTSAVLDIQSDAFETGGGSGGPDYGCRFTAIEAKQPFRPARVTPKPIVQGPQTAIVVGPPGEEIHTDEFGRVRVHFHWDRHQAPTEETSSCWVRVSQVWAGRQWGAMHIPRVGQEVIVEFLEGDPDQPIITGRVYNGDNMPVYGLPANKTQSGLKSRSSKGGSPANFNELRFEDLKGSEQVYMQAEKDLKTHVKKNETRNVGGSLSTSVGGGISRSSGGSHSRTAGDSITDKATKSFTLKTGTGMSLKAGGSYQLVTNEGIHLKTINFVMELIEAGIEAAMASLKGDAKEGALAAKEAYKGDTAKAEALGGKIAGQMSAAFGPAIGAASGELTRMCSDAEAGAAKVGPKAEAAGEAAGKFAEAVNGDAGAEAVATAFVCMAVAAYEAYADAKALIDGLLPKIPSIVMWAMKDIQGVALWNVAFESRFRDISLEAKARDVSIKAKKNVNIEASTKDFNIKAGKKNVNITAKEKISVKAEDNSIVIEAAAKNVTVKAAKQIQLKCGSASITLLESGDILIRGGQIKIKGTKPVEVKGTPIKLN